MISSTSNRIAFINPGTWELLCAWNLIRDGFDVTIIDEADKAGFASIKKAALFPSSGSFFASDIDQLIQSSGLNEQPWSIVPRFRIVNSSGEYIFNTNDGAGGLTLVLDIADKAVSSEFPGWLQKEVKKATELLSSGTFIRKETSGTINSSVAAKLNDFGIGQDSPIFRILNGLSHIVSGCGIVQLDAEDFPRMLTAILAGWRYPEIGEAAWRQKLEEKINSSGARFIKGQKITEITGKHDQCEVWLENGIFVITGVVVHPLTGKFPCHRSECLKTAVIWVHWKLDLPIHEAMELPCCGVINMDPSRPPINDNFIAWHARSDPFRVIILTAPVEMRYLLPESAKRFGVMISQISRNLKKTLGTDFNMPLPDVYDVSKSVSIPATIKSVGFMPGHLWGDDLLSRISSADSLRREIVELIS